MSKKDKKDKKTKNKKEAVVTPQRRASDLEKSLATERGEAWVRVTDIDLDEANVGNGAFELDFNDIFVAKLVRAGYSGKTDFDIVDQWFNTICRNIVLETYEQEQADPRNRTDLGGGRAEYE